MMLPLPAVMKAPIISVLHRRDGAAALEFALCVPILLTALLGVIEFGRVLWSQNALHYGVEEAARCLTVGTCTAANAPTTAANAAGYGFTASVFTVTGGAACGNQVTASYNFPFLTSFISYPLVLTAQSCFATE